MGMTYWGKLPRVVGMLVGLCLLASLAAAGTTKDTSSTSSKSTASSTSTKSSKSKKKSKKSKKVRGQKAIDATRTKQIQQALIEQKYMQGEPSGKWDDTTQAALRKYQSDHGWQSKTVPDSRALIKLGLGPSKEGLLNPETAMTSASEHPATSAKPTEAEASGKSSPR
jgi:peptidoglycan hydrolase-like protein with peptidoglycan-binding domain